MQLFDQLRGLGFLRAGRYTPSAFEIYPDWRAHQVVYVWTQESGDGASPLRVGVACGPKGFGRRYDHYNRWLAGRFKPDDRREQKVRALFLEGLADGADVWARQVADKPSALSLERALRRVWEDQLKLDLMVRESWAKQQMNAWRKEQLVG
jgi:hypothetical protein